MMSSAQSGHRTESLVCITANQFLEYNPGSPTKTEIMLISVGDRLNDCVYGGT
jgi:hypothetical protein